MRKKVIISLLVLLVVLAVAYLGVSYVLYDRLANIEGGCTRNLANRPDNFTDRSGSWREDFDYSLYFMPGYETVTFASRAEGIEVAGWYVEAVPDAPAVILVHGLGSCKHSHTVLTPAGMLHKAGFNVLMIDVRDAGDSTFEDGRSAIGNEEYLDVLGAWDWLVAEKGMAPERIGLGANATFWFPEGVEHVRVASTNTAEYEERLVTFFQQALGSVNQ